MWFDIWKLWRMEIMLRLFCEEIKSNEQHLGRLTDLVPLPRRNG